MNQLTSTVDIAEEAADYANVRIDWTIEDAPDGDGWLVTSSQWGQVIHKRHVRYLGIVDPRKPRRNGIYSERSRHADYHEASRIAAELRSQGGLAEVWFDSYAREPHRVMILDANA